MAQGKLKERWWRTVRAEDKDGECKSLLDTAGMMQQQTPNNIVTHTRPT